MIAEYAEQDNIKQWCIFISCRTLKKMWKEFLSAHILVFDLLLQ